MSEEAEDLETELTLAFERDFPFYSSEALQIRVKVGETRKLSMNRSQRHLHERIEEQLARTGKVRVLILKSRQVGISTYFAARSYWKVTFNKGLKAFVITHDDDTTAALFDMIKRFHDNVPDFVRPIAGYSNAKEMTFSRLDSGYAVSTAGNKSTGRGQTFQVFHGSEVSRWPNAPEIIGGGMEAVPDMPGTEIWLESTAAGIGDNTFYKLWVAAVKGENEFLPVFIPWFWHEEYEAAVPEGWLAPIEWAEYADLHGLTTEQLYWAYTKNQRHAVATSTPTSKISWLFRQEYPATADEAFSSASKTSFVPGEHVQKARKVHVNGHGPIVLGVDVARGGADKSAIIDRQGRRMGAHVCQKFDFGKDTMPLVGEVMRIVREMRMSGLPLRKIIVDSTGVGGPVYDLLRERLGDDLVYGVDFGGGAYNKNRFANRRAEMWSAMKDWFGDEAGCAIPDNEELQMDICAPAWGDSRQKTGHNMMTRYRSDGALVMEEKNHIKQRQGSSPDFGDAAAMTFAVSYDELIERQDNTRAGLVTGPGAWML